MVPSALRASFAQIDAEELGEVGVLEVAAGLTEAGGGVGAGGGEEVGLINAAQGKEEVGPGVEEGADAVEDGGGVLAEVGVVRAGAVEADLAGAGKEAVVGVGEDGEEAVAEFAGEEIEHGGDLALAGVDDFLPAVGF